MAIVTWTGEADVDLLVEEPSGTLCSLRNPAHHRPAASCLATPSRKRDATASAGISEVYVCPKGFDGTYRMWSDAFGAT